MAGECFIKSYTKAYELSKDIHSQGKFSLNTSAEEIYRILRSVDYGKQEVFPPILFTLDDDIKGRNNIII